ncbi:MAG: putative membrane protein, partial [Natronomonas sp.]|uniref:DUF2391 family protein n=2 Tax=Natronomonas sp. TaxID=2184060 RepID=UPI0039E461A7
EASRDDPGMDAEASRDDLQADEVAVEELLTQLEELEASVDDPDERREVQRAIRLVDKFPGDGVRESIKKFTRRDIAESFVGAILISLPMLLEDGVFEIAEYLLATPWLFAVNAAFVVLIAVSLLYFADIRDVDVHRPIFGVIPRRLLSVLVVAFVTATFMMTLWGRLEGWQDASVALSRICVVWTVASLGAALGDILPGESSGTDINDELDDLGERVGIGDEEGRF